jgi:hypothetical protein
MGSHLNDAENGTCGIAARRGNSTQRNKISIFKDLTLPFCAPRLIGVQKLACEIAKNAILNALRHESGHLPIDMPQRR